MPAHTTGTATSRAIQVRPAKRRPTKARLALSGPSGSGKTWTALGVAEVLAPGGRVLVIDSEQGDDDQSAAELYADQFSFDLIKWDPPYDPRDLAITLDDLGRSDHPPDVVIVDSATHFWRGEGGTLDIAGGKFGGWRTADPAQSQMIDAILGARFHIIVCTRAKHEYLVEEGRDGKQKVTKLGMAPVQRDDLEYEFQVVAMLDIDHRIDVTKSRAHPLAGQSYPANSQARFAATYKAWLDSGIRVVREDEAEALRDALRRMDVGSAWSQAGYPKVQFLDGDQLEDAWRWLQTTSEMPSHAFETGDSAERCAVCECHVTARWHRSDAPAATSDGFDPDAPVPWEAPEALNDQPAPDVADEAQEAPEAAEQLPIQ